jgi:SsrA-binding protein
VPSPPPERRNVAQNRKARHEFEILETFEAGLLLVGSEVKSLRQGKSSIDEAYVGFDPTGRAVLFDAHIPPYVEANRNNHEPTRPRPLLLHALEVKRLRQTVKEKGLTLVPLQLYFKGPYCKLEFALGRGRKLHDKRQAMREADDRRETQRALRDRRR